MNNIGEFHHGEDAPEKSTKMVSWIVAAVLALGIGVYVLESGMLNPAPTGQSYPRGL